MALAVAPPAIIQSGLNAIVLGCDTELGAYLVRELAVAPIVTRVYALSECFIEIAARLDLPPALAAKIVPIVRPYEMVEIVLDDLAPQVRRVVAFCCLAIPPHAVEQPREFHLLNFVYPARFIAGILRLDVLKITIQSHKNADYESFMASQHSQICGAMQEEVLEIFREEHYRGFVLTRRFEPGIAFFQTPTIISQDVTNRGKFHRRLETREKTSRMSLAKQRFALRFGLSSESAIRVCEVARAMFVDMKEFILIMHSTDPTILRMASQLRAIEVEGEEMEELASEQYRSEAVMSDHERLERRIRTRYLDDYDDDGGLEDELQRTRPQNLNTLMLPTSSHQPLIGLPRPIPVPIGPMAALRHEAFSGAVGHGFLNANVMSTPAGIARPSMPLVPQAHTFETGTLFRPGMRTPLYDGSGYQAALGRPMPYRYAADYDHGPAYGNLPQWRLQHPQNYQNGQPTGGNARFEQQPRIEEIDDARGEQQEMSIRRQGRQHGFQSAMLNGETGAVLPFEEHLPQALPDQSNQLQSLALGNSEIDRIADGFNTTGDALEAAVARIGPNVFSSRHQVTHAEQVGTGVQNRNNDMLAGHISNSRVGKCGAASKRRTRSQMTRTLREASMYSPPPSDSEEDEVNGRHENGRIGRYTGRWTNGDGQGSGSHDETDGYLSGEEAEKDARARREKFRKRVQNGHDIGGDRRGDKQDGGGLRDRLNRLAARVLRDGLRNDAAAGQEATPSVAI